VTENSTIKYELTKFLKEIITKLTIFVYLCPTI